MDFFTVGALVACCVVCGIFLVIAHRWGEMKVEQILPTLLITIDVGAGLVYLYRGQLRLFVYWLAAATLTACVTFGK